MNGVLSLTLLTLVLPASALAGEVGTSCPGQTGLYQSGEYGYSFIVPAGLSGEAQSPCLIDDKGQRNEIGDHGLQMKLDGGGELGVFADYAADLDDPTLEDVLKDALDRMAGKDIVSDVHFTEIATVHLKGRRGYRVAATSVVGGGEGDAAQYKRIEYIFRSQNTRCVIYLRAPIDRFAVDARYLEHVLATWRWTSN